ncbi:MAG TPA: sodium:solute symporter [Chitinophagales bacterium]|nr:sodium:solute symporter [Chitinophagales bacterium]HMZ88812.1 sodium:solute symporter [Chitinophagales bacterium]HNE45247.1 sodium:solute symporter [Chitinophagales bacterium]HNI54332.1 sodium:solute symporter [Chitinophagales bacterium]HNJ88114.1 sodium:solute symporter [Chitinophagales bacterium]
MSTIDWLVMFGTLLLIAVYGIYRTRQIHTAETYLRGDNEKRWWEIGLSVMATQASAITFLSVPGQAYDNGLGFIQFYLGLPLAMIVISVFFIPIFYRLKVYTAYEFLENRFDVKSRTLTAVLFLVQRAFSTGITIYAPSIILSQLLGWPLTSTVIFIGGIVTLYILSGGNKAVTVTHKQQMLVIYAGMFTAFGFLVYYITRDINLGEGISLAGYMGKMHVITTGSESGHFDWSDRYNIVSGLIGGLFLQLSYFGTDQSQVGRYIGGASVRESRLGLLFNGLVKIPVQFFILFIGLLVFTFYQLNTPPVYFNDVAYQKALHSDYGPQLEKLASDYQLASELQQSNARQTVNRKEQTIYEYQESGRKADSIRLEVQKIVEKVEPSTQDDHDYIFMRFVMDHLPVGVIGLLFAVIFCASMSSTASALNGLSTTFSVDIYKRFMFKNATGKQHLQASKMLTAAFGILAIMFALIVSMFDNLIEAVNILGSLFYGTILGIFLTAFLLKRVGGNAVFVAAVISELVILYIDFSTRYHWNTPTIQIGYLWYNVIGCLLVMGISLVLSFILPKYEIISEGIDLPE